MKKIFIAFYILGLLLLILFTLYNRLYPKDLSRLENSSNKKINTLVMIAFIYILGTFSLTVFVGLENLVGKYFISDGGEPNVIVGLLAMFSGYYVYTSFKCQEKKYNNTVNSHEINFYSRNFEELITDIEIFKKIISVIKIKKDSIRSDKLEIEGLENIEYRLTKIEPKLVSKQNKTQKNKVTTKDSKTLAQVIQQRQKIATEPKNSIWLISPQFKDVCSFSEGLAAIKIKDKWEFINHRGEFSIQLNFNNVVEGFRDGLALVSFDGDEYQFINKTGKTIVSNDFSGWSVRPFSSGLAAFYIDNEDYEDQVSALWGFININGEVVVEPSFFEVTDFNGELAKVKNTENGKDFYINKTGRMSFKSPDNLICIVIENENILYVKKTNSGFDIFNEHEQSIFTKPIEGVFLSFSENIALYKVEEQNWGFNVSRNESFKIDGELTRDSKYSHGFLVVSRFDKQAHEEYLQWAKEQYEKNGTLYQTNVSAFNRYHYIDIKGEKINNIEFKEAKAFSEGHAAVKTLDGLWGFLRKPV